MTKFTTNKNKKIKINKIPPKIPAQIFQWKKEKP